MALLYLMARPCAAETFVVVVYIVLTCCIFLNDVVYTVALWPCLTPTAEHCLFSAYSSCPSYDWLSNLLDVFHVNFLPTASVRWALENDAALQLFLCEAAGQRTKGGCRLPDTRVGLQERRKRRKTSQSPGEEESVGRNLQRRQSDNSGVEVFRCFFKAARCTVKKHIEQNVLSWEVQPFEIWLLHFECGKEVFISMRLLSHEIIFTTDTQPTVKALHTHTKKISVDIFPTYQLGLLFQNSSHSSHLATVSYQH